MMKIKNKYFSILFLSSLYFLSSCTLMREEAVLTVISESSITSGDPSKESIVYSIPVESFESAPTIQSFETTENEEIVFSKSAETEFFDMCEMEIKFPFSFRQTKIDEIVQDNITYHEYLKDIEMSVSEWTAEDEENTIYQVTQFQLTKGHEKEPNGEQLGQLLDVNYEISDIEAQIHFFLGDDYDVENSGKTITLMRATGQTSDGKKAYRLGYYSETDYEFWGILIIADESKIDQSLETVKNLIYIK